MHRWHRRDRTFHAQIATRDHNPVRSIEDRIESSNSSRLLDLRHQCSAVPGQFPRFEHVLGPLNEGKRQPVDPKFTSKFKVNLVLLRQGREWQHHIRDIDTFPVRDRAANSNFAFGEIGAECLDAKPDFPVIHQQRRAFFQRFENLPMRQLNPRPVARLVVQIEAEILTLRQILGSIRKRSHAQFRSLKIGQYTDRPTHVLFHLPDDRVPRSNVFVRPVAHVQTEHVGPGFEKQPDHLVAGRGRAERGYNFDISGASHSG